MSGMASNLIPMLSSSPPPLDENGSFDDEDDEFGDFTGAGVKVLDSPLASPVKKSKKPAASPIEEKSSSSKKVTWNDAQLNGSAEDDVCEKSRCASTDDSFVYKSETIYGDKMVVFSEDVEQFNCDEDEIDFGEEKPGLSAKYAFTHSEQHDNTSQESVTDSGLCSSSQRSETSPLPPGEVVFPELSPETEVKDQPEPFLENSELFLENPEPFLENPEPFLENPEQYLENPEPFLENLEPFLDNPESFQKNLELVEETQEHSKLDSDSSFNCDFPPGDEEFVCDNFDDNTTPVNELQTFDESLHVSESFSNINDLQDFSEPPTAHSKLKSDEEETEDSASCSVPPNLRTERFESEDFDDFADFTSAPVDLSTDFQVEQSVSGGFNDSDGFADFSHASFDTSGNTDESDWSGFTSIQDRSVEARIAEPSASSSFGIAAQVSVASVAQVHVLLGSAFPGPTETLPCMELATISPSSILGVENSRSLTLWHQLEDLDESVSLQFQWSGSQIFQTMLRSLNIDSRNVLHNPSVPLFALGLGLLEPVRLAQWEESPADFLADDSEHAEELIPPAQFDWSSSGLVNPLDPSQANSALLDLDFFNLEQSSSTGKTQSVAKTSSLEEELLRMDLMSPSPLTEPPSRSGGDLVRKLLSSVPASTSTLHPLGLHAQPSARQPLSPRATGLLDLLPDLSFMQAKVLMFPIRGTLDS